MTTFLIAIAVLLGLVVWMSERDLARLTREFQVMRFDLTQKLIAARAETIQAEIVAAALARDRLWPDGDDSQPWPQTEHSADIDEWEREIGPQS